MDFWPYFLIVLCVVLIVGLILGNIFDCATYHAFHSFNFLDDCDSYFCPLCGAQLKDLPVFCPACSSEVSGNFDFCPDCGGSLE